MVTANQKTLRAAGTNRRGSALLICLFVVSITTVMVVSMLDAEMLHFSALRNTENYERANYLAGAGVSHALAELEADSSWRTGIGSTEFPSGSGDTYSATVVDGTGSLIVITALGTSGGVTRQLVVTVEEN